MDLSNAAVRLHYYKRRYNRAYALAVQWYSLLYQAQHYCIPNRNLFYYTNQVQGVTKNAKIYDTTAVAATRKFVAKAHGALTPPQQTWAKLEAGTQFSEEDAEKVNAYLEKTNAIVFDYIRHSNFDLAINECYYDLAVGTFVLVINEGDDENPLLFSSIPLAQMAFEESVNGRIESAYRTWGEVKISEIEIMWPKIDLPEWMRNSLDQDPNASVAALYEGVVYMHGEKEPFKYVVWVDSEILLEESYWKSPWIIARWAKHNTEIQGRGPIMDALPSIISLNEMARLELVSANLNVCRPYMAFSDGVFNPWTFNLTANTIIPIARSSDGIFPIQALPDVAHPEFGQITSADLRMQINTLLFASPLGEITENPKQTATEVAIRQKTFAEEVGPSFTRLQQEYLAPTLQKCLDVLQSKGIVEKLEINGTIIQARYQSPLVLAQGQQDVDNFVQYCQTMQLIYGEEGASVINPINTPGWVAMKKGVDKELVLTKEELKSALESRAQAQQMQQQAEMQ